MLHRELMKKGLAKAISLVLAVSLAMPGTAMAAATQTPDEAVVEEVYEDEGVDEEAATEETVEETAAPIDENSQTDDSAEEEIPASEEEEVLTEEEDDSSPADIEEESASGETEVNIEVADDAEEDFAADGETAETEIKEETPALAGEEASQEMNMVTDVTINSDDYTTYLGVEGINSYQMDVTITYDTSTSYETNEPVYYRSTDEDVLTVDNAGKVTAVGTGYAYVYVYTTSEYGNYDWDSQSFSVQDKQYSVQFDLNGGAIAEGLETEDGRTYKMYKNGTTGSDTSAVYLDTDFWNGSEYSSVLVKDGYLFEGWTEVKDGSDVLSYSYYPTHNVTLYAKWSKAYTVNFDLNGGTIADGLATENASLYKMYTEGTTGSANKSIYLQTSYWKDSESHPVLIRDGYRLSGWTEVKDGANTVSYSYTPTKDVTLYAKWIKVCTLTFDLNGGSWSESYYEDRYGNGYMADQGYFYLPGEYAVEKSGYKLVGWTTTKDGASVLDRDYNVTKDVTLYAKWGKVYTVTFNAGAGHFGTDTTAKKKTYEAVSGENIGRLLYYDEYTPINGSKVFLGWYKDSSFKTPAKKSDTITKNITYYAKWATKTYKITVTNLKGASYWNRGTGKYVSESESTATSYTFYIQQGDSIGSLYAYKNDEQARLFLDKACKTKPYYYDYVPTANTTVYAKWNGKVTITWQGVGGKDYSGNTTGKVTSKKSLMCENLPTKLTKAGYYFVGWYDAADKSKKTLPASHVFSKNTTVKAKWAKGIKITFKSGGGTFSGNPIIYIKAKTAVGPQMDFYVTRKGYTLKGWKSSATGKVVKSMASEKPAKAVTYTAVWAKNTTTATVNVTLVAGAGSLYDDVHNKYVTKLVVKVPKNSTLGSLGLYYNLVHDEPYKKLQVSGWALKNGGTALKSTYKFTKSVTLYPLWKKYTHLTVALVTNGGAIDKHPNNNPTVYYVAKKGTTISLPTGSKIEREGYTFLGWYTDSAFKNKIKTPSKFKVTKNCYVYAKWKKK